MPDAAHSRRAASVLTASACAFAIIATQVAGKATRDALFLTNYDISALPMMLMASALLSIGFVLLTARAMSLLGPSRVVPPLFLLSGLLLVAEWILARRDPQLAAVIVYLHIAVLGSILISGFWSIINEHFEPRSARRSIARIVGGATVGGLFGGFLADRVGAQAGILWVLPIIALLQFVCAALLPRLGSAQAPTAAVSLRALLGRRGHDGETGFAVLRRAPYVRNLALIVLLGNVAATLVDFLFKARAAESYPDSADLVRFFAIFYTAVSLLTLAVQAGMTRRLLENIGLGNTMAARPALVTVGGLIAMPWLGILDLGILRGLEAVAQSSFFRSGYELLFNPVVPEDKRKTKTLVDVGADRMGDVVGALLVRALIMLPAALSGRLIMLAAVAVSVLGFVVARALQRGYVRALESSLLDRAQKLDITPEQATARTTMMESFAGLSLSLDDIAVDELRRAGIAPAAPPADADAEAGAAPPPAPHPVAAGDPEIALLLELRSGDANRVTAVLRRTRYLSPAVAAQVAALLAWDQVTGWASRALAKVAPSITGQLVDRLLDPDEDFAVRRRIPRILATCETPRALVGLMGGLHDRRFEVRFQCARALARIHLRAPSLAIDTAAVYAAVSRETRVGVSLWREQRLLDEPPPDEAGVTIEAALHARASRSLEHVFTLLSLVLPRDPLQIAFKGLLTDDAVLRGTSLEYLESVLPRGVWDDMRPVLEDSRESAAAPRSSAEVLEELLRSSASIDGKLASGAIRRPPPA